MTFTICELARYQQNPYAYSIINERINQVAALDERIVVARNLDLVNGSNGFEVSDGKSYS